MTFLPKYFKMDGRVFVVFQVVLITIQETKLKEICDIFLSNDEFQINRKLMIWYKIVTAETTSCLHILLLKNNKLLLMFLLQTQLSLNMD